ncbi:MAG: hypothetical protein ABEJ65_09405, partial [bacterium]
YLTHEGKLGHWDGEDFDVLQDCPESPRQLVSGGDRLYLVGESGRLFQSEPSVGRWKSLRIQNFMKNRVRCREISSHGNTIVIRDENGRLLLASRRRETMSLNEI